MLGADIEVSPCRDWEEALRYEQLFALPTTTGPLWRMRVLAATPTTHKMRRVREAKRTFT